MPHLLGDAVPAWLSVASLAISTMAGVFAIGAVVNRWIVRRVDDIVDRKLKDQHRR